MDSNNLSGKKKKRKKTIREENTPENVCEHHVTMLGTGMNLLLPPPHTSHTHFVDCPPVLEVSYGRMGLRPWIKLLWKELRGSCAEGFLGALHLSQELHLSSGSRPWPSPGLCCKWVGTWHYTLPTWASTLTQIFDFLAWSQDLSPCCGPAWQPMDCWLSLSATEVTVTPPSQQPSLAGQPTLAAPWDCAIMLALFLMHI